MVVKEVRSKIRAEMNYYMHSTDFESFKEAYQEKNMQTAERLERF